MRVRSKPSPECKWIQSLHANVGVESSLNTFGPVPRLKVVPAIGEIHEHRQRAARLKCKRSPPTLEKVRHIRTVPGVRLLQQHGVDAARHRSSTARIADRPGRTGARRVMVMIERDTDDVV